MAYNNKYPLCIPAPAFILPAALTAIEADAFQGISAIAVQIPASVTSISDNPFIGSSVQYIYGFTELVKSFAEDNGYLCACKRMTEH